MMGGGHVILAFHAELGRSLRFWTSRFLPGEGRGLDPARGVAPPPFGLSLSRGHLMLSVHF